jgi:prepilin-type N-terminal cleavage/methylation domain-containing protein
MKTSRGFSLLELLIVVAIILIIATVAVPSFLRSRQTANEKAAVANMRTLVTAEMAYASSGGVYGSVSDLVNVGLLLDDRFNTSSNGYSYQVSLSPDSRDYMGIATAVSANLGRYDYYVLPDAVVRYSTISTRAPAGQAGMPVN